MKMTSMTYLTIGKARFIGADVKFEGDDAWDTKDLWEKMWQTTEAHREELHALLTEYGTEIQFPCSLVHSGNQELATDVHYIAGYFFRENTPIPAGLQFYDIKTIQVGFAVFQNTDEPKDLENAYISARDRILQEGHGIPYPEGYWNAEVHTGGDTSGEDNNFGYMFPISE